MSVRAGSLVGMGCVVLASALSMGAVYGPSHVLPTAAFFALFGLAVMAASLLLARQRAQLGSLSRQFVAGAALVFGLTLVGVGAIALLMFVRPDDAFILALLLAFAGGLVGYSARVLARGVKRDIELVRDRLVAVGEGQRDLPPLRTGGRDEIEQLATAADRMTAQLANEERRRDAAEAARRDLISSVSHDLRTPLTSLQLIAQAIDDGLIDSHWRESIPVHVRSMSALVDDLFELSRIDAGEIQWSMERVRLDDLVRETVDAMRASAATKRIAVSARLQADLAPASANPEKVQRVLFNLIQNAIRHTPADGSVTVTAESNDATVEIEVADTGAGIPEADRELVFEPFYRAGGRAARSRDGSGLGLAICRGIVEVHGGSIWLAEAGRGTSVRFTLPRAS